MIAGVHESGAQGPDARLASGKFLTFFLGQEEYGIEILRVQEIIGMLPVTSVPGTPAHLRGIINLRGQIIPVVDLRRKLGMEPRMDTPETCIIVVNVRGVAIGIIVDRVSEVLGIAAAELEAAPSLGKDIDTDVILGIGKSQSKIRILLDIEHVLAAEQVANLEPTPATQPA